MNKTVKNDMSTVTTDVENATVEIAVLHAECDPSLEKSFVECLKPSGFRTKTDAILTLARDLIAGRIKYKNGILQNQGKFQQCSGG